MNIAIFEDNADFANTLGQIIQEQTHHPAVINTSDSKMMEQYIECAKGTTLYFLDIVTGESLETGQTTGLALAEKIAQRGQGDLIVFVTQYPDAIVWSTAHKTIAFNVIFKHSVCLRVEVQDTVILAESIFDGQCLQIKTIGRYDNLYIPLDAISYVEKVKDRDLWKIYSINGVFPVRKPTAADMLAMLGKQFVQCHRGYIINRKRLIWVDKSKKTVVLDTGEQCPYSQHFFKPEAAAKK